MFTNSIMRKGVFIMRKYFLLILLILVCQNYSVHAMQDEHAREHGIVFKKQDNVEENHPYLKGINIKFIPLQKPKTNPFQKEEINKYNIITTNEYASLEHSNQKYLATLGVYDCIIIIVPSENMMAHVNHTVTGLKSIKELFQEKKDKEIFLCTLSITHYLKNIVDTLIEIGFKNERMTLYVRPLEEELSSEHCLSKYRLSYDEETYQLARKYHAFSPDKFTFYLNEEDEKFVKKCHLDVLNDEKKKNFSKFPTFSSQVRRPLNIILKDGKLFLFKIDQHLVKNIEDDILKIRPSLSQKEIVKVEFN